jgi:hypothetical protein
MAISFDLIHTMLDETAWLESFLDVSIARARLKELAETEPGEYYILDQSTGQKISSS